MIQLTKEEAEMLINTLAKYPLNEVIGPFDMIRSKFADLERPKQTKRKPKAEKVNAPKPGGDIIPLKAEDE